MMKLRGGRTKRLIMDIGSSAVRLCELTQTKTGYQLTKYYHREFNIDPSLEEQEQRQARLETIAALLKDAKVRYKKTVFGVPGQSVFTRTRALPPVPEYKVTQIVRYEIQQQIPFSLDQIAFDYQVLQRTEAGGYDVLMAAIKVEVVEKRLEAIRDIKKQIDTVDVCPLAAYNWLKTTGEFGDAGECVALIDLGAATTDIVIERDNLFRFTRSLNLGGNDVTSTIAAEFNVSFAEAEKLKRERGFAPTGDPQRDGRGGEIVGRVLNRLVSEITRSFAYFRSQPGGGLVNRIIVTGGGACLRNIIPFLQRQLGIEVRIAQPLAGLAIGPGAQEVNEHPEQAAVALGLAVRCCQDVPIAINLIPPRIMEAARRREQIFYWALSVATLGLILASIIPALAQQNKAVRDEIELLTRDIAMYDQRIQTVVADPTKDPSVWKSPYETEFDAKNKELAQHMGKVQKMDDAYRNRISWLDYMVAINDARPKGKTIVIWSLVSTRLAPPGAPSGGSRGPGGRFGAMGTGAGDAPAKISSTGFGGILSESRSTGSTGFGGFNRQREDRPQAGEAKAAESSANPGAYNGITIRGFAGDVQSLLEYVDALSKSNKFVKVYFEDRFTDPVSVLAMDNAGGGQASSRSALSASMSDTRDDRDDRRDRRGMGRIIGAITGSAAPVGNYQAAWNQAGNVYTFRIDLQILGPPISEEAAPASNSPPPRPSPEPAPASDEEDQVPDYEFVELGD